jgi:hypothetical protein
LIGISTAQFDVLNQVLIYQPITESQFATKVPVFLECSQEGYIHRKQDWKTKWITLTKQGEDKIHEVFEHQLTFQTSIVNECLTEEEQRTLYKLMTKLQKHTEDKLES